MEDSSSSSSSDSSSMRKGGRVAYCTALLMRSLLTRTAGSNPVPSSIFGGHRQGDKLVSNTRGSVKASGFDYSALRHYLQVAERSKATGCNPVYHIVGSNPTLESILS